MTSPELQFIQAIPKFFAFLFPKRSRLLAFANLRSIKRILLVRTDRLGDVILTLPMLAALRKCFPDAYIALLLRRYTGELLVGNPHVNELLWYDENDELVPFGSMCATLRERQFDAAIVVYPRLRLAWLLFRSGIPIRVGTGYRYYSFLFNRRVYEHRKDALKHEVEYNLNLLSAIGCRAEEDSPKEFLIAIPPQCRLNVHEMLKELHLPLKGFMILHPGSGGSAREWSAENFGMLAVRVAKSAGLKVVVTGGRGEEEKVSDVIRRAEGVAIPIVGTLSIKEFAVLIESAKVFVSNSTGPLHLAVAMGTPVVGLFPQHTAMSARRWGPYTERKRVLVPAKPLDCRICFRNGKPCECMASISVEAVAAAILSMLEVKEHSGAGSHA